MRNNRSLSRSDHRRHDRLLVTRFAMGDSYPTEQPEARQLVDTCNDCAALAADVRLIAASMQRLPQPRRSRDFRLTAEQAQRAHGSAVERFFRALGGTGWATLRPVAGVAMSIGLVLAVVGAMMPSYLAPASAPSRESGSSTQAPRAADHLQTPAPVPTLPSGPVDQPTFGMDMSASPPSAAMGPITPTPDDTEMQPGSGEVAPVQAQETEDTTTSNLNNAYAPSPDTTRDGSEVAPSAAQTATPMGPLLIFAGIAIAALSLGLLTLAWFARRRLSDPLLR